MPQITFIEHDGSEHVLDVPLGQSLMQAAVDNSIPGILGDCGGSCACATCHGYLDPAWQDKVPAPADDERELLEVVLEPSVESRLTCQLSMSESLAGAIIRLPQSQT
ncbi:Ferredoxin-6 [compost metagenome]